MTAAVGLAAYQRQVRAALQSPPGTVPELIGGRVLRWSVEQWAALQLRSVCPLTSTLLTFRGRYAGAVAEQLARPGRGSLHEWGLAFLVAHLTDDNPLVADVARLEHAMTAPGADQLPLPDPWTWQRDPADVVTFIATGRDPALAALLDRPVRLVRRADGALVTQSPVVAPAS